MHLMMGLRENFKPIKASLLSRSSTYSLDVVVNELISEGNGRPTYHMSSSDHVLPTPSPTLQPTIAIFTAPQRINSKCPTSQSLKDTYCEFCYAKGHNINVYCKL